LRPLIPVILETACLLATLIRPNHIVDYAHGVSFICRGHAIPMILGIDVHFS
jgi:hypothetical protein